uniref:JmjC domain-containing protein n=1 Tax=Parastrongyloides trichosuri TaxID=131310 RepID=A0A0N4ZE53_PARTI
MNNFMTRSKNGYSYIFPYNERYLKQLVIEVKEDKCYRDEDDKKEMKFVYQSLIDDLLSDREKMPQFPELLWLYELNVVFENTIFGDYLRKMILNEKYYNENRERIKNFLFKIIHTGALEVKEKIKWKILYTCFILIEIYYEYKNVDLSKENNEKIISLIKKCDNGLMVGIDVENKYLSRYAFLLHEMLPKKQNYEEENIEIEIPKRLETSLTIPTIMIEEEEKFITEYFNKSKPVIIKGYVNKWDGYNKWNHKYFYINHGYRNIPVEYGKSYTSEDYYSKVESFCDYLDKKTFNGYLAQHDIFHQIPILRKDVMITSLIFSDTTVNSFDDVDMNIFLGKSSSYSPLHQDPRCNFFCQVYGKKFVRLASNKKYDKENELYCYDSTTTHPNSSRVNVFDIDYNKYPSMKNVIFEDYLMEAGDCLFIPRGYFHSMYGITNSISLSQWFGEKIF